MTIPPLKFWSGSADDWSTYLDEVYSEFLNGFVRAGHTFLGKPVKARYNPSHDNKHFSFWHVMSEAGSQSGEEHRVPDLRRCERIALLGYVLANCTNKTLVLCWTNFRTSKRGRDKRYVLYLPSERYVVILAEKDNCFLLVSAYYVAQDHSHNKLMAEQARSTDPR